MPTDLRLVKKKLRKDIKQRLVKLSNDEINTQSLRVQQLILDMPQYHKASRISVYLSMPTGEARTETIVRDALRKGKRVFVPYLYSTQQLSPGKEGSRQKVMDMLALQSLSDYQSLARDPWDIPSLSAESIAHRENALGGTGKSMGEDGVEIVTEADTDAGGLDLVIMPGVAFNAQMHRLGHGAGFYDRFLARLHSKDKQSPFLVGLCLAEQFLPLNQEIPVTGSDWKVDAVAVGDGKLVISAFQ